MEISASTIAHVIVRAREIDAKVARWDQAGDAAEADTILEEREDDATETELRAFIETLNDDEKYELIAVMWIGRDTFDPEDWDEAVQTARDEHESTVEDYLLGIPLLADYLEDGMEKMGLDPTDEEDEIYRKG